MKAIRLMLLSIVIIGFFIVGVFGCGFYFFIKPGPACTETTVLINKGSVYRIRSQLQQTGLIQTGRVWDILFLSAVWATKNQGKLKAAEYLFPEHASIKVILDILRYGKPVQHFLTIAEGLTARQIQNILQQAPYMSDSVSLPEEGAVLPQTYSYVYGYSRQVLLNHMKLSMNKKRDEIWQNRNVTATRPLASVYDMIILASIVERETSIPSERYDIAQVFLNRLKLGMKLQSDPTVVYGVTNGHLSSGFVLTRSMLDMYSEFNTYQNYGLPPTPICSPGQESMEAVAHPSGTEALYFVADGKGGHIFSRTLAEHNRQVFVYRARQKSGFTPE